MTLFEAALPLLSPLDAQKTLHAASNVFAGQDPQKYDLRLKKGDDASANAVLKLTEGYRKDRVKALFEKISIRNRLSPPLP